MRSLTALLTVIVMLPTFSGLASKSANQFCRVNTTLPPCDIVAIVITLGPYMVSEIFVVFIATFICLCVMHKRSVGVHSGRTLPR